MNEPKEPTCSVPADARDDRVLRDRLARIRRKVLVLSGKGGVGKSTVAANLAVALSRAGRRVGLLDVDFHGPSIPRLLGLAAAEPGQSGGALLPVSFDGSLKVMSLGFLIGGRRDAVIWRGPLKMHVIRQLLEEVDWGDLDVLVIDFPPGTGDEPLSVAQLIPEVSGAVVVTTPQQLAVDDVRRCIGFCEKLSIPVLGVVENMSGFTCPHCGASVDLFGSGGGEALAAETGVPFLGSVPIDPVLVRRADAGEPFVMSDPDRETTRAFLRIAGPILALAATDDADTANQGDHLMRIAVPVAQGRLATHFGHCETFALVDVDRDTNTITASKSAAAPPHEPGLLPRWLAEQGASVIIAGGMGQRAQSLFAAQQITVVVGAPALDAETLVTQYLDRTLEPGENVCDH